MGSPLGSITANNHPLNPLSRALPEAYTEQVLSPRPRRAGRSAPQSPDPPRRGRPGCSPGRAASQPAEPAPLPAQRAPSSLLTPGSWRGPRPVRPHPRFMALRRRPRIPRSVYSGCRPRARSREAIGSPRSQWDARTLRGAGPCGQWSPAPGTFGVWSRSIKRFGASLDLLLFEMALKLMNKAKCCPKSFISKECPLLTHLLPCRVKNNSYCAVYVFVRSSAEQ